MTQHSVDIIEGKTYNEIENSSFSAELRRKTEGRKVLVKRIYKRLGASERSFECVFLARNKRSKDYIHTFLECEKLAVWLKE